MPDDIPDLAAEANALYAGSAEIYKNLKQNTKRLVTIIAQVHRMSKEKKAEFRELMDFSDSQFSVLAKIGRNQHLWTPAVEPHLTGNVSIDYITARLEPEEIDAGIQQGIITIRTTRPQILKYQSQVKSEKAPIKGATFWTIKQTRALNRNERETLEDFLAKILSTSFVDVIRPEVVATLKLKRPIRKSEGKWFGDIKKQVSDLEFVEIDDKFDTAGRKHQTRRDEAVRDAVNKAVREGDSSWKNCSSVISDLRDEKMQRTLLASIGIDFDALKAEAHKRIKEPAIFAAVEQDQPSEEPAKEALPVETEQTDTGAKSSKPPKG